jgi:hypothetical protein
MSDHLGVVVDVAAGVGAWLTTSGGFPLDLRRPAAPGRGLGWE